MSKENYSSYSDIVKNYTEYQKLQKDTFCSFESENTKYRMGQQRCIKRLFSGTNRQKRILDIACGDGVGLREFKKLGFKNVIGVEFNDKKLILAGKIGYRVLNSDMHNLSSIGSHCVDIVYSSHTLEHAYYPDKVIRELYRVLVPAGRLYVILPYPDTRKASLKAHGARLELGTNVSDNGVGVVNYFKKHGFSLLKKTFDSFREPEIWLALKRK
ncbi:class I SAM-dependent methyltransferase [Candidatus Gottesmanbacteria bacterium]|nr:class I SAM-dependent methyltransferase [Candidatus Gottesmanbacteria bacterium]